MVTGSWEFEFNSISFISVFSNHVFFTGLLFKCLLKCLKYLQNIKRLGKKSKCLKAGPSEYEARCTDCNSIFSIKNGGHLDVKRHCSGNAGPEQGFSINKSIIAVHGTRLGKDVLIALRRVEHHLLQVGDVKIFKITRPLLESIKQRK